MNAWSRVCRLMFSTIILLAVLGSAFSLADPASPQSGTAATSPAALIPAPPTGGPQPTLALQPDHGYAGQSVTVTGQGVAPYPGVRVAWLTDDATLTAAVITLEPAGTYSVTLTVPADAVPGPAQVCAAVTGTELAEFACAAFTIDAPPPGTVQGQLPLADTAFDGAASQSFDATFLLLNATGAAVGSAPINPDGTFTLDGVAPGIYDGTIVGSAPVLVNPVTVDVRPSAVSDITMVELPTVDCLVEEPDVAVATVTSTLNGPPVGGVTDFGTYIALGASGSTVNVTFRAHLQTRSGSSATVQQVEFSIVKPDGSEIDIGSDATAPYEATYNVSRLPEGISVLRMLPILSGGCAESSARTIEVMANPMANSLIRDGQIHWDAAEKRYEFSGTVPQTIPGVGLDLPVVYPDPPPSLPLIGRLENKFDTGFDFEGYQELNNDVHFSALEAHALARLFSRDIFDDSENLMTRDMEDLVFDWRNWRRIGYEFGPYTLYEFGTGEISVFRGVLASFWGVVTVNASVSVGIDGSLVVEGTIRPLKPALDTTLTTDVGPRLSVSLWVDILLGVASAGADANARAGLHLPLHINTEDRNPVRFENQCLDIDVTLDLWARVNLLFWKKTWNLGSHSLVDYSSPDPCHVSRMALAAASTVPPPRVMAAPAVASGPSGQMLSVYVQDTTPQVLTPTMQVMARFWDAQAEAWGDATPLTVGDHAVQDPAVAFVGTEGHALVVWTENTMSLAEDDAAGDDLVAILARQEVFFAYWDGYAWSAPQQLTNDALPDGRVAIAGDDYGATLAWVRDTDGDISTRTDWRIAVSEWDVNTSSWSAIELLDASSDIPWRITVPTTPNGVTATTATTITIPAAVNTVTPDGQCDPGTEYADAVVQTFPDAFGSQGTVYLKHDSDMLYACVVGAAGTDGQRFTSVYLDTDDGREPIAQADDYSLRVAIESGELVSMRGTGVYNGYTDTLLSGWTAFTGFGNNDVAEYTIPLTLTSQACGAPFGLAVYHHWVAAPGDDYGWPSSQFFDQPQTWATANLAAPVCPPATNAQPSVVRADGGAVLAWTVDANGDLTTNGDRRIAIGQPVGDEWIIDVPVELPTGADSPTIALGPNPSRQLAFLVRGKDGDGETDTGIGNQAVLWTADYVYTGDGYAWQASPLQDEHSRPVRAERPLLDTGNQGETVLLFRRFGVAGTHGELGQLALTRRASAAAFAPPLYLTDELRQHWQPALTVNPEGQAMVLNVGRAALGGSLAVSSGAQSRLSLASVAARPTIQFVTLAAADDPVESFVVEPDADPALDPILALSQEHVTAGSTVEVTATLRNVGRSSTGDLSASLYEGTPLSGTLLATADLNETLDFNEALTVTFSVTAAGGEQPLYAVVSTDGDDLSAENNVATAVLGELPPPTFPNATRSTRYENALEITWLAPDVEGVEGYRVLRGETSGGPYELVGEAVDTLYSDLLLERGQLYHYVVQAYDAAGVRSAYSAEATGMVPWEMVYLPLVLK